jgi:dipeptidyl aminopeptidase/acylaminoacyl peptidase
MRALPDYARLRLAARAEALALALTLVWLAPGPARAQGGDEAPAIPSTVRFRELERAGQTLWLYLPSHAPPCALVVIPPAGGTLLTAPGLGPGDRAEHVPYAEAGLAVLSFSLSGELTGRVTPEQVKTAIGDFARARGGIADAQRAIASALAEEPALAGKPLAAAGHSSAANLALALAADDARIRAVVASAPVADTMKFLAGGQMEKVAADVPGALALAEQLSPLRIVSRIRAPAFFFHAEDDDVAPIAGTRELQRALVALERKPVLLTSPSGGHYDAMIATGLPAAVRWVRETLGCATAPSS